MTIDDWHKALLALVVWREAEGETLEGKQGVAWVIRNRVAASHIPEDWSNIITARAQFSSMTTTGNARLVAWPKDEEPAWTDSMDVAQQVLGDAIPDPTDGATLYCNLAVCHPEWADVYPVTAVIDHQTFFKG